MKILLLTDKLDNGGAETHLLTLARSLTSLGCQITVASSGGAMVASLSRFDISHLTLPLHRKDPISLLRSYLSLRSLCRRLGIQLIHSHARVPSLIAHYLSRDLGIPLVTTAHARFSLTPLRRRLSRWGDSTVAVSEDLKQYLVDSYSLSPSRITVIPNGIDTSLFTPQPLLSGVTRIAFLSRLDSDCSLGARLLCAIAPTLCRRFGRLEIVIGGGGSCLSEIARRASAANSALGFRCVRVVGRVEDVPRFLRGCSAFVGVSRAAAEAALCGIPVILCGDEGFFGHLTADRLDSALATNLCARGCPTPRAESLLSTLTRLLRYDRNALRSSTLALRGLMAQRTDSLLTAEATLRVYRSARLPCRGSPEVLLCGYYGFGNMGDDALLRASTARAYSELCGLSVGALTRYPVRSTEKFGLRCIDRGFVPSLLWALMRCKYFILGGGTLLQADTSRRSLLYYVALLRIAHLFGAKCLIWGGGLGTLSGRRQRALTRGALGKCAYVGLRDKRSCDLARALGAKPRLEGDLSDSIPPCSAARAGLLLGKAFGGKVDKPFIIIAPRRGSGLGELERAVARAVAAGALPLTVAMHSEADGGICRALRARLGGCVLSEIDYSDLLGIMSHGSCAGVYSMRFHALLAARRVGVPYYAFGSDVKLNEFKEK